MLVTGEVQPAHYVTLIGFAILLGLALHWSPRLKTFDILKGKLSLVDAQREVVTSQQDPQAPRPVLDRIQNDQDALAATVEQIQDQLTKFEQRRGDANDNQDELLELLLRRTYDDLANLQLSAEPGRTLIANVVSSSTGLEALRGHTIRGVIRIPTNKESKTPKANLHTERED